MSTPRNLIYPDAPHGLLKDLILGIDHIGLCVRDIDRAGAGWSSLLGVPVVDREDVVAQKTTAAFLRVGAPPARAAAVELVCPMPGNAGLDRFLDSRGDGLHHIAFAVSDIRAALARLAEAEVRLIDTAPRAGAGGHQVAFLHPKAMGGALVELVERSRQSSSGATGEDP